MNNAANQAMTIPSPRLVLVDSTPTEMGAGVIVAALEQEGIQATMTGTYTAGFRAEAPGWVKILVAEEDLPRAQRVLHDVRQDRAEIDWSQVDVGEATREEPSSESPNWLTSLTFWRRIASVLIVLYLTWLAVGIFGDVIGILIQLISGTPSAN